jgi:hypothetical protein
MTPTANLTPDGQGVTRYLYDGDKLTAEYDGSGQMLRRLRPRRRLQYAPGLVRGIGRDRAPIPLRRPPGIHHGSDQRLGRGDQRHTYDEYGIPGAGTGVFGGASSAGSAWVICQSNAQATRPEHSTS